MPNDTLRETDLTVGVELEFPLSQERETTFRRRAFSSSAFYEEYRDDEGVEWTEGGKMTNDGSVGAEIVSGPEPGGYGGIPIHQAPEWYANSIEVAESAWGKVHEPVGMMASGHGSTAGLHIHLSPVSEEQARDLYRLSEEPWMKVFACSTLYEDPEPSYQVFRNNYCNFSGFSSGRTSAVRQVESAPGETDHFEWRLPEPMTTEHFELLMEFLARWYDDPDDGADYARGLVMDGDPRLTSVQRAEALGIEVDPMDFVTVTRSPRKDTYEFFYEVYDGRGFPYIYRVVPQDSDAGYYAFVTHNLLDQEEFESEAADITFTADSILDADTLTVVDDADVAALVEEALERPVSTTTAMPQRTEATDVLAEALSIA